MKSVISLHLFKTTHTSSEKGCFRSEGYSLSKKVKWNGKSKTSHLSWLVNEKITISKAILIKDWRGTSSSRGAYLWNASTASAFWMASWEIWCQCCDVQQAGLRFAEPISADEKLKWCQWFRNKEDQTTLYTIMKIPHVPQIAFKPSTFPVPASRAHFRL